MINVPAPAAINGDLLVDELAAAGFPGASVYQRGDELVIVGPDDASRTAVTRVAAAHAPPPTPPPPDPDGDLAAAIDAVDTSKITDAATKAALDALKAALTGNGKPAAVAGRPAR
jgi:hypothetical protein